MSTARRKTCGCPGEFLDPWCAGYDDGNFSNSEISFKRLYHFLLKVTIGMFTIEQYLQEVVKQVNIQKHWVYENKCKYIPKSIKSSFEKLKF